MKDLRSLTVKQIKEYMKENNICIEKAYKMRKEELIVAIESAIEEQKTFNPDEKYIFSKDKFLGRIKKERPQAYKSILNDESILNYLKEIDGKRVKSHPNVANRAYVNDKDWIFTVLDCILVENTDEENEVKIDSRTLSLMPDETKVIVKVKDFKDKNKYFRSDLGILKTCPQTGYRIVRIKNHYRTRHVLVSRNKNIDFFVSSKALKLIETEKIII